MENQRRILGLSAEEMSRRRGRAESLDLLENIVSIAVPVTINHNCISGILGNLVISERRDPHVSHRHSSIIIFIVSSIYFPPYSFLSVLSVIFPEKCFVNFYIYKN